MKQEYRTQEDLFRAVLPALQVKKRINKYYGYDVTNDVIWSYLGKNKWRNDKNLTIAEIVNDIIVLDMIQMKGKIVYDK